mmetsp:Transcript_134114/g.267624  ORF Transcript_134114/g.267624 Transcript_134114/m.267624 type:complete len:539 (+) Transcript_134114:63-1679(+)
MLMLYNDRLLPLLLLGLLLPFAGAKLQKPNIVFVLVDDWGWANVGYHTPNNSEVRTPNIDQLVKEGIELNRHYAYHYCSPSRASIQSGRLPVHVGWANDHNEAYNPTDPDSGFAGIPRNMTGMAEKMRQGGYRTHMTGKWDAGMATWDHTPMGRGYETWLGYYHHANDYWTQQFTSGGPSGCGPLVDLWNTTGPARHLNGTAYEEEIFTSNTLDVIERHNPEEPLFLFHAFHQIHTPLEVPPGWLPQFSFLKQKHRRNYAAMVHYMDWTVGKIVTKLKKRGMWDNTLMLVHSDNGGPIYNIPTIGVGGANNLPLRGGKLADWEGGIRVNAFMTGGAVPPSKRGTILEDYIHECDWYATFASIAGVDVFDNKAHDAGLPPVDGVDHSALLLGAGTPGSGKRTEIHHSVRALTVGRWKLITGGMMDIFSNHSMGRAFIPYSGWRPGWGMDAVINTLHYKNCGHGCLFDIKADPNEHKELSATHPDIVQKLKARLKELNQGVIHKEVGHDDPDACTRWNGFYGPWVDMPPKGQPNEAEILV